MAKINREEEDHDKRKASQEIDQHATSGTNISDRFYCDIGHYYLDIRLITDQVIVRGMIPLEKSSYSDDNILYTPYIRPHI
jgi:hypothetical protein